MAPPNGTGQRYVVVGLLWFLVALGLGATDRVASWRPPVPQLVLVGLTGLLVAAVVALPRFRRWLLALDLRWLIALHLTRFVGIYFLFVYYRDGTLPRAFAVPGGWGDIIVATLAFGLLAADILFVVATASRLARADPDSMNALLRLPLSLLPTFLVPLLIADHVVVFWRIASRRTRT